MKLLFAFLLLSSTAFAECDIDPLKNEIKDQYKTILPVTNHKGEIGHASAKNFKISDYLMKVRNENFLISNFDLDIKWLKGNKQTVKMLVVGTVDPVTCKIDSYEGGDNFGSSLAKD